METVKSPNKFLANTLVPDYSDLLEAICDISSHRPPAIRKYDQIYMKDSDLLVQTLIMSPILAGKTILFVGDGDSMSLSLLYLARLGFIPSPKHCVILDFDKRIVNFLNQFAADHDFADRLTACTYNVIDPLPETFVSKFDYFYTNPPYGASNGGASIIAFLARCLEGCKALCGGCIIIPVNNHYEWSLSVLDNVRSFLLECGAEVSCILPDMHSYHLDDNPDLRSSTIMVERYSSIPNKYCGKKLPDNLLMNFYGHKDIRIPKFVSNRVPKRKKMYETTSTT